MQLIWVRREGKSFCKRDWTGQISLIRFNKSPCFINPLKVPGLHAALPGQVRRHQLPERLFIKIKFQEGHGNLNYSATFRYQSTLLPREKLGKGKP
jgi:hypothetical protein